MAFVGKNPGKLKQHNSPEEMYKRGGLPRSGSAVSGLWTQQGDVLRAYTNDHQSTPDLAMELPTGTGKTLPGLLIAEWNRRKSNGPILYAAPTKQLALQVLETALVEGIPGRLLVGNHRDWNTADEADVYDGEGIGITSYNSIFNSSPKLPQADTIIFDDAHAAEQFVGEQYALTIPRQEPNDAYFEILDVLAPFFSKLLVQRLCGEPDPGAHHQVRLVLPAIDPELLSSLDHALSRLGEPFKFTFSMIRGGLAACCVYVSYGAIQIRPMVPPTFQNNIFENARQRIYLSATLGAGGELERSFGRSSIVRMPHLSDSPPRSGRRLFVFPELVEGGEAVKLTQRLVDLTDKALVLTQSTSDEAESIAKELRNEEMTLFGRESLDNGLGDFADSEKGILALANRYDGMDLPGESCRIVILNGLPDSIGLQEKFLSERVQANSALFERLRTRVVQGAGRCTRGPNDYAVVVVLGTDINRYFSMRDNRTSLDIEIQAEVEFGWENSKGASSDDIVENVEVFLEHDTDWLESGETLVGEFLESAAKKDPAESEALGNSSKLEVEAWQFAFTENWGDASRRLEEAARAVGVGGEATRNYRGLLLYLAGVWAHLGARSEAQYAHSRKLLRDAQSASNRGTWLREMKELPGADTEELARVDEIAIDNIVTKLTGRFVPAKIEKELDEMVLGLEQDSSGGYEPALTVLGKFLGAESFKPGGSGRCDSAWCWDNGRWLTIEAKSEEHSDGLLPLRDIRQANTQLDQLAADRGREYAPTGSQSILVCDRLVIHPDHAQTANSNVFLCSTDTVAQIAYDVNTVWLNLLTASARSGPKRIFRAHVKDTLTDNGCLPTQVIDRLMQIEIKGAESDSQ